MRSTTDRAEDVDRRPHGRPQAIVHYLIAHAPASFQQKHLGIAQILVATHQHLVARLQAGEHFVLLRILAANLYRRFAGRRAVGREAVYPLSGRVLVKVAAGYDKTFLRLAQLNLHAVAFAQADVRGLFGREDEVAGKIAVLDLGHYLPC